jgi:hypothetical protein
MVQTRSQTKHLAVLPEFNFNEASEAWLSNKIKIGNGCYKYICGVTTKTGRKCMRSDKCRLHSQK